MKNLKNITAMLVLVTVMGVSTSFGGVYYTGRGVSETRDNAGTKCTVDVPNTTGGILISDFAAGGILISDFAGILISDLVGDAPACGGDVMNSGILISD